MSPVLPSGWVTAASSKCRPTRSIVIILAHNMTRRTILSGLATAAIARPKTWKPKLGVLGNFSEDNIDFTVKEGFTSIGLWAHRRTILDAGNITGQTAERVKQAIS